MTSKVLLTLGRARRRESGWTEVGHFSPLIPCAVFAFKTLMIGRLHRAVKMSQDCRVETVEEPPSPGNDFTLLSFWRAEQMNVKVNGQLIRELRIKHSYSQERLAEIISVNPRTIQRIETKGVASLSTRGALAKAFSVRPEDLDLPEAHTGAAPAGEPLARLPHWPLLLLSAVLVVLGWVVLAVSIRSATPIGLVTPPAVGGLLIALIGFVVLTRLTPLRRWRTYAVLSIVVVAMAASPPAWTIRALVVISLWAAFELGILLTRLRRSIDERPRVERA